MKPAFPRTAVVTGAASGLGRLLTLELARRGVDVAAWDRDAEGLKDLPARTFVVDVTDRAAVAEAAQATGPVDLLINNAGVVSGRSLLDTSDEQIERTFAVNTLAAFWTTKAFLPAMLAADRGHLVTIASAAGLIGVNGLADYSASKFAAVGFHEALRMELRSQKSRVRTTVVCPFFIDTGMFAGVRTKVPWLLPILKPEAVVKTIVRAIARGRRRVILPWFVYSVLWLRGLPVAALDFLADLFGINHAMDRFTGRQESQR